MAVPVARVHLKVAHAALPALLPTPPKWKMLPPLLPTPRLAVVLPKPPATAKPGRADADERWDAHKPGRADSVERWDARKKAAAIRASSSMSSSATPSLVSSSRASSAERWDVHKKRLPSQAEMVVDDGESSSTGSNDVDTEEEILWKPRDMYAGPGFVNATPKPSILPMPTAFLVPVA